MQCGQLGCEASASHLVAVIEEPKATSPDGRVVSMGGRRQTLREYCEVHAAEQSARVNHLPVVLEVYRLEPTLRELWVSAC